ncbi:MAG: hypothetical protein ACI4S9_05345 [Christensenellales bacterium]
MKKIFTFFLIVCCVACVFGGGSAVAESEATFVARTTLGVTLDNENGVTTVDQTKFTQNGQIYSVFVYKNSYPESLYSAGGGNSDYYYSFNYKALSFANQYNTLSFTFANTANVNATSERFSFLVSLRNSVAGAYDVNYLTVTRLADVASYDVTLYNQDGDVLDTSGTKTAQTDMFKTTMASAGIPDFNSEDGIDVCVRYTVSGNNLRMRLYVNGLTIETAKQVLDINVCENVNSYVSATGGNVFGFSSNGAVYEISDFKVHGVAPSVEINESAYKGERPESVSVPEGARDGNNCTIIFAQLNGNITNPDTDYGIYIVEEDRYFSGKGVMGSDGKYGIAIFDLPERTFTAKAYVTFEGITTFSDSILLNSEE